ncbi:MAG: hypothetical protein IPM84_13645 [Anaerolineae bacterium]|nr:hypothetical protein [Anaerolineae bacterium]
MEHQLQLQFHRDVLQSQPLRRPGFHNIETRLLREISEDAIKAWAKGIDIIVVSGKFGMGRLGLRFQGVPVDQSPSLTQEIIDEYSKGDAEYQIHSATS